MKNALEIQLDYSVKSNKIKNEFPDEMRNENKQNGTQ